MPSRLETFVAAAVSKWPAWRAPENATADQIQAADAHRVAYVRQLRDALGILSAHPEGRLHSAIGKVLGRVESDPPDWGVPEPATVRKRVEAILDAPAPSAPGLKMSREPVILKLSAMVWSSPAATVISTISVPAMHESGSRTRKSFSNPASTL